MLPVAELRELEAELTWGTAGGCERDACAGGCDVGADACHEVSEIHKKDMDVLALPYLCIVKSTRIGAGDGCDLNIGDCDILLFGTSLRE